MACVVHRLVRHASRHRPVADHGNCIATIAAQITRNGKAECCRNRRAGVGRAKGVIGAFAAFGEAGQTILHPQGADPVATSCQDFMGITLMGHVPNNLVLGGVENRMQGDGHFHNTQPRSKVTTRHRHGRNRLGPHLISELA